MARAAGQNSRRLAQQILKLVLDARFERGHHLREQALADLLGVSRTPVRAALQWLAQEGLVEMRPNQGFFLARAPLDEDLAGLGAADSGEDALYRRLVNDRLAGDIPDSVTQTEIARRYGADRIAVLRTLDRMAEDGLIERNKGHGWTFLPTLDSDAALRGGYSFRLMIEPGCFLLPGFKPDRAALERSRLQHLYLTSHPDIASVTAAQLFETDAAFHEMFAAFSGNAFVLQAIQQQNRLRKLMEFAGYVNRRRVRDWCGEHLAIIDAVAAGHYAEAGELMRKHLTHADDAAERPGKPAASAGRRASAATS
ncbi:GntR family transcriptional regulator [Xylophilus rhododendri]|uniref:GntR family transcriptional regulator n=1 Tax=Xylophilus rhododendri TaxID=2697032 RepID=A0A857J9N5_9BURK|nr:GntR family transcriptional regulator [Xylophilus rhododendri]QHI99458.1 GntR family transcriptional regulator [Xylophilus rhododendri]